MTLYTALRDRLGRRAAQGGDVEGTPGRPAGHRRVTDRHQRVPAGGSFVRGEQGRDQDPDPCVDRVPGPPPWGGVDRGRRRRDVVGGEPAGPRNRRCLLYTSPSP